MGNNVVDETPTSNVFDGSETNIEIKIKTLDSQTYTLRVDKQMPVPALKEQIATVTGVLSDQQRLICRGKVLKDDQLLSAYHVEDGHTLHMVVRQPLPPSESLLNNSVSEPISSSSQGFSQQIAPGVVIETFSLPMQGDGIPPEINQIVSAVLGSFGLSNMVSGSTVTEVREYGQQRQGSISTANNSVDANQHQSVQTGQSTASSLGSMQPPIIPDSLTTLSRYISHMRSEFDAAARDRGNVVQTPFEHTSEGRGSNSGTIPEGLPTPASLAEVMLSTRQILVEAAGECLLQLARQLENQVNVTDPIARVATQSNAWRTGVLSHNLGALLLELGRTVITLRMGQSPSEAVVNAGPAVFISQSAPNPIMVQPLPFPTSSSSNSSAMHPGSNPGAGFLPRRIDIQIRRGSSSTPNSNREEHNSTQNPSGQRESDNPANTRLVDDPFSPGESGVRVVPVRTMIATMQGPFSRSSVDSSNNSFGLYYPLLGRFQQSGSGSANGEQGSEASEQRGSNGPQAVHGSVRNVVVQQMNVENFVRDGLSADEPRQEEPANTQGININIVSGSGTQNIQHSNGEPPESVFDFLRRAFPVGENEISPEDASILEAPAPEHETTANPVVDVQQDQGSGASDEGIFLSNILRQIMPRISQQIGSVHEEESISEHTRFPDSSSQSMNCVPGPSRSQRDNEADAPSPKRQKTE